MNICVITSCYFPELTGVSTHVYNMLREYSKKGHKVKMLCPVYGLAEDVYPDYQNYLGEIFENVFVVPAPSRKIPQIEGFLIQFEDWQKWNLDDYIEDFQADVIIVEDPARCYDLSLLGIPKAHGYGKSIGVEYARKKNIPVVGMYHTNFTLHVDCVIPQQVPTPYRQDKDGVYQKIFAGYDVVLCACNEVFTFISSHGLNNVKHGRYVGINEEILSTTEKSSLVSDDGNIKLFYAGRLNRDKDIYGAIAIYNELKNLCPNVSMYIAGGGEGQDELRNYCLDKDDIVYLGKLTQVEVAKVYNSADIYFSPHPTETYGISILEAMSMELPVVTSDSGGPKDLVEKGVSGFRCSTTKEYIQALKCLVEDKALRQEMGKRGRKFASQYYCSNCVDNFLNEIEILKERRKNDETVLLYNSSIQ